MAEESKVKAAKKKGGSGNYEFCQLVGCGGGGVSEMKSNLDNEDVMFGLLVFAVGSGTFLR